MIRRNKQADSPHLARHGRLGLLTMLLTPTRNCFAAAVFCRSRTTGKIAITLSSTREAELSPTKWISGLAFEPQSLAYS